MIIILKNDFKFIVMHSVVHVQVWSQSISELIINNFFFIMKTQDGKKGYVFKNLEFTVRPLWLTKCIETEIYPKFSFYNWNAIFIALPTLWTRIPTILDTIGPHCSHISKRLKPRLWRRKWVNNIFEFALFSIFFSAKSRYLGYQRTSGATLLQ